MEGLRRFAEVGEWPAHNASAADLAVQNQHPNPRPLEQAALQALLQSAQVGARPET